MIFATEIRGVPCKVCVTYYVPADSGRTYGPPERCYPPQPAAVDFDVLDEQDQPDLALRDQMDDADTRAVEQEAIAAMEEQIQAERDRAAEDRAEDRRIFGVLA
ncbi:hypothetical protein [Castellaniella sp. UC4442_H9]